MRLVQIWRIFRGAIFEWSEDKAPRMAGAMAFYTVFSLTPVVIIAVGVAGMFVGREAALGGMLEQVKFLIARIEDASMSGLLVVIQQYLYL